eukprot:3031189-Prymnesium_polylepis.4
MRSAWMSIRFSSRPALGTRSSPSHWPASKQESTEVLCSAAERNTAFAASAAAPMPALPSAHSLLAKERLHATYRVVAHGESQCRSTAAHGLVWICSFFDGHPNERGALVVQNRVTYRSLSAARIGGQANVRHKPQQKTNQEALGRRRRLAWRIEEDCVQADVADEAWRPQLRVLDPPRVVPAL